METFVISKETEDKVKLAKKFIQDKYQNMLIQQKLQKQSWDKILQLMKKNQISEPKKDEMQKQFIKHQLKRKRLMRQKDFLKNYEIYQMIGKGAFGQVRIARNKKSNEIVAIKRIQKKKLIDKNQLSSAHIQKELMRKNHDSNFLIKLHSTFQDKNYLYIVMDYAAGGDLLHLLIEKEIFSEQETKFYIAELITALEEMQFRNIIHRDIKPDNILIDKNGHIKISDFGLSKHLHPYQSETVTNQRFSVPLRFQSNCSSVKNYKILKSSQKHNLAIEKILKIKQRTQKTFSKVGTPDYISPQVLFSQEYDYSVDIWSVGVIMFQCLFGYPPFSDQNPRQVCKKVVNWSEHLIFPSDIDVSLNAKILILGMVNQKSKRMTINQIKEHPFFKGIEWKNIKEYQPPLIPKLDNEIDTKYFDQFDQSQKWTAQLSVEEQDDNLNILNSQKDKRMRSLGKVRSNSADYLFAGFEYRNIQIQPFQILENQINAFKKDKKQVKDESQKIGKKNPQNQKRTMRRLLTEVKDEDKSTQIGHKKLHSQKYLFNKRNVAKNLIQNPNQTSNNLLGSFGLKLNSSVSTLQDKTLLHKQSKLKPTRKTFNCIKRVNKLVV